MSLFQFYLICSYFLAVTFCMFITHLFMLNLVFAVLIGELQYRYYYNMDIMLNVGHYGSAGICV